MVQARWESGSSALYSYILPMTIMGNTRLPAVAGSFYPAHPDELAWEIRSYLGQWDKNSSPPKALIVPHAGIMYSGPIAASGYAALQQHRHVIRKVILIGPAHRVPFHGLAVPTVNAFRSPLGDIKLDQRTIHELVENFSQLHFSDQAHQDEHALEVQLPFLQSVVSSFRLIPLLVGDASTDEVAEILKTLWGGETTLVLISSDLSHFESYARAQILDHETAQKIELLHQGSLPSHAACGRIPIQGLLKVAHEKSMRMVRFDLRNSGDTSGPKDQVVGYGCWGCYNA